MDFCLYLITDRKQAPQGRSLETVLERAFEAGVRGVLLREKDLPDNEYLLLAQRLRDLTLRHRVRLMMSGRVDIAIAVGADGVHMPSGIADIGGVRAKLGVEKFLAVSTHSIEEARRAEGEGADFITFGPVFSTPSKASYGPPVGVAALETVCREIKIPVFALGGIKEENAIEPLKAGAFGLAVISAVIAAEDPGTAARSLMEKIRSFKMRKFI